MEQAVAEFDRQLLVKRRAYEASRVQSNPPARSYEHHQQQGSGEYNDDDFDEDYEVELLMQRGYTNEQALAEISYQREQRRRQAQEEVGL
jgi:hypothetical protein